MLFRKSFGFFLWNLYCSITRGIERCVGTITAVVTKLSGVCCSDRNSASTQVKCLDTNCNVSLDKRCNTPDESFELIRKFFCITSDTSDMIFSFLLDSCFNSWTPVIRGGSKHGNTHSGFSFSPSMILQRGSTFSTYPYCTRDHFQKYIFK